MGFYSFACPFAPGLSTYINNKRRIRGQGRTETMARNKGVTDATGFQRGKPSGIENAMSIAGSLESGCDISGRLGSPDPIRGTKTPVREVRVTRRGGGQSATRTES
jgi:hypothetical protein